MKQIAIINSSAVDTWLEPYIGHSYEVLSQTKNGIEIDLYEGSADTVILDKDYFDFLI